MRSFLVQLSAALACVSLVGAQQSSQSVKVGWVGSAPSYHAGTTFGVPWPRGKFDANKTSFSALAGGAQTTIQSWVLAYWPDGSVKWSAHAVPPPSQGSVPQSYQVVASGPPTTFNATNGNQTLSMRHIRPRQAASMVTDSDNQVVVDTGRIKATFPKSGNVLLSSLQTASGKLIGQNGKLVLRSQDGIVDPEDDKPSRASINRFEFEGRIDNTTVQGQSTERVLITITGTHQSIGTANHDPWLQFVVRFYLYKNSEAIRIVHSVVYDRNSTTDFITGLGIRMEVPLAGEKLYDRHVRLAGPNGGLMSEAIQGITGLRRDPGASVRSAQFNGSKTPDASTWDQRVTTRLQWIPAWNDYRLTQLSSDGFNLQKRTKQGQSWVKIAAATQSGGLAYLGGATVGGLAIALRDFWKRYPTSLDISDAATDTGALTVWMYSPSAPPMDLRPYHDGLGEDTYAKQLDALEITYEDYEPAFNTPYGIARTNEVYLYGFDASPSQDTLARLTNYANNPGVLMADSQQIHDSKALGPHWSIPGANSTGAAAAQLEGHLTFLDKFYQNEVSTRRFHGFWDHGDFYHSYDLDRHVWRYDIGGYAWDNSELSPDLYLWNQVLRTRDLDLYRFAEAQVRHGGEVDSYHIGPMKGLGTRHGIQHWGDSAKQARISTPIYRRVFYYLTGGDERTGEILEEMLDVEKAFVNVDARRKVRDPSIIYTPDPKALLVAIGIEWAGMASGWIIEWERRGPRADESRTKILRSMADIAKLKNGFVTNEALYNSETGAISPPINDANNTGVVSVSHLSGQFGMLETIVQLIDHIGSDVPPGFETAFVEYCYYYSATAAEQKARYGQSFSDTSLIQGHSRYTAYAAYRTGNATTAARAWKEFFAGDGITNQTVFQTTPVGGSQVLVPVQELSFASSNDYALYGLAATENLAFIGQYL